MAVNKAFHLKAWIDENRHLLKPPVGNKMIYTDNKDFIVMVVGGPNSRKDYHLEDGEELFYQLEGDIVVKTIQDGNNVDIAIQEGEMFLLPANIPHSPQRGPNTIGLVIERNRAEKEIDSCLWFCEKCAAQLHEAKFHLKDIVTQLPKVMDSFYNDLSLRTCKKCGTVMEPPAKLA